MNEEKLFTTLGNMDAKLDSLLASKKDHETRLRRLEGWKAWATGLVVGVSALVNLGYRVLTKDHA